MKLFELMRQIQDACRNDGNLEKEVVIFDVNDKEEIYNIEGIITDHPNTITIEVS